MATGKTRFSGPLAVSHVADHYRRYPGETVTFYTRVDARASLPGITLKISMPPALEVTGYRTLAGNGGAEPLVEVDPDTGDSHLIWNVAGRLASGSRFEYAVEAVVTPTAEDGSLRSRALAVSAGPGKGGTSVEETVGIAVEATARYLKHLPTIYHDDELMSRFLMLFESFWAPIERQIDSQTFYLDPRTIPSHMLPWMASWVGLDLDRRWPEEKQRQLILAAISLYRKRGTRQGLQDYLELYTGARPQIMEHRSHNFRLGAEARLGRELALGTENVPHHFTVVLRLSPTPSAEEEAKRRQVIESIIESEMPAHAGYTLRLLGST